MDVNTRIVPLVVGSSQGRATAGIAVADDRHSSLGEAVGYRSH